MKIGLIFILFFSINAGVLAGNTSIFLQKGYDINKVKDPFNMRCKNDGEKLERVNIGEYILVRKDAPVFTKETSFVRNGKKQIGYINFKEAVKCSTIEESKKFIQKRSNNCVDGIVAASILENSRYNVPFSCDTTNNPILSSMELLLRELEKEQGRLKYFNDLEELDSLDESAKTLLKENGVVKEKHNYGNSFFYLSGERFLIPPDSIILTSRAEVQKSNKDRARFVKAYYCKDLGSLVDFFAKKDDEACIRGSLLREDFLGGELFTDILFDDNNKSFRGLGPVSTKLTQIRDIESARAKGYYTYRSPDNLYGREEVIQIIEKTARVLKGNHSIIMGVGDISKFGGGQLLPHRTHRHGTDVDLRLISSIGSAKPLTYQHVGADFMRSRGYIYSRGKTIKMLETLIEVAGLDNIEVILFNDPAVIRAINNKYRRRILRSSPGHDDHIHVAFRRFY